MLEGSEVDVVAGTQYAFVGNQVSAGPGAGVAFFDFGAAAVTDSTLQISGNLIDAGVGADLSAATFGGDVRCAIVGNRVENGADVALNGQRCLVAPAAQ